MGDTPKPPAGSFLHLFITMVKNLGELYHNAVSNKSRKANGFYILRFLHEMVETESLIG